MAIPRFRFYAIKVEAQVQIGHTLILALVLARLVCGIGRMKAIAG